jgi:hypothetical protein
MAEGSPLKQGMAGITLAPRSGRDGLVALPRVRVNPRRMVSSLRPCLRPPSEVGRMGLFAVQLQQIFAIVGDVPDVLTDRVVLQRALLRRPGGRSRVVAYEHLLQRGGPLQGLVVPL